MIQKFVVALIAILFSAHGFAEGPCKADIKKLCADVKPGGGGLMRCLKQHEAELSSNCKSHREKIKCVLDKKGKNSEECSKLSK